MKVKEKDKVLIYALYDEKDIDDDIKKEELLKKYCNDKGYDIIKVIRKPIPYSFFETAYNFVNILKEYLLFNKEKDFNKVLVYDIRTIAPDNSSLLTLLTILKENRNQLESIVQGKLNFNPLDKENILGDDYIFDFYACEKNRKYFLEDPFIDDSFWY